MNKRHLACIFATVMLTSLHADEGTTKKERVIPVYGNRINFEILRLGYEHIKPDAVYVALEGWYLFQANFTDPFGILLAEAEGRIGYNFLVAPQDKITPFVGAGYFKDFSKQYKQGISFASLGLRYEHEFNRLLTLGLNSEGLLGYSVSKGKQAWGNPIWGFDVSIPLTFRFGRMRNWDCRVEPFFTEFFGKDVKRSFFGARSSFGYRF